jgi:hypothetical protein
MLKTPDRVWNRVEGSPMNEGEKPIPDQYAPGGVAQQSLDWNVAQHQSLATEGGGISFVGPTGPQGGQGAQDAAGIPGAVGVQGPAGDPGAPGVTGPAGAVGPIGPTGMTGSPGATGAPGPSGPQGTAGSQGSVGPTGPAASFAGVTGATGGYVQLGNVIQQWGTSTADAVGVTVTFPVPYASVPFVVATGEASTVYAKPTPTGVTIRSPSGPQTVSWQALGC